MAVQVVTQENMAQAMSENDIVVLEFWASWCAPCRLFTPVYEQAAQRNPDIFFGTVNTEEQKSMVSAAGIVSIPTLMIFRQSVLVFHDTGPRRQRRPTTVKPALASPYRHPQAR